MAKIDTEVLFNKLKAHFQANIPVVIAAINTEKGDGNDMLVPDSAAYIDLDLDTKAMNYDPFVFIYIDRQNSEVRGGVVSKEIKFDCTLFVAKSGLDNENILALRYSRMMEEVASLAWDKAFRGFRFDIETLDPVDVQLRNSTKWHKVYGVALTVSLAN